MEIFKHVEGQVADVFSLMDVAEDEIERACCDAPLHLRPLVFGSFMLLQPTELVPEVLYRGHCRELLCRVLTGEDLDWPTLAEIAMVCCEMTLVAPMREAVGGVYMRAFQTCAPELFVRYKLNDPALRFRESWTGEFDEVEQEIARHISKRLPARQQPRPRSPSGQRRESMEQQGIIFPQGGDMHTLYTVGYAGLKADDLDDWAAANGALVIDTRMNPYSPRPEWMKAKLAKLLGDNYRHVPELGNVNYKNGGEIAIKDTAVGYRIILEALAVRQVVLLCGCKDVETCHRKYIAEQIEASTGDAAVHLTPDDVRHVTRPAAKFPAPDDVVDEPDTRDLTQRGLFSAADDVPLSPTKQLKLF